MKEIGDDYGVRMEKILEWVEEINKKIYKKEKQGERNVNEEKVDDKTWSSVSNSIYVLLLISCPLSLILYPLSLIPYPLSLIPYPLSLMPYPLSLIPTPYSVSPIAVPFQKFRWGFLSFLLLLFLLLLLLLFQAKVKSTPSFRPKPWSSTIRNISMNPK